MFIRSRSGFRSLSLYSKTYKAWTKDGGKSQSIILRDVPIPFMYRPDDVLVEIHAASVNPLDVLMSGGYGTALLKFMNQVEAIPKFSRPLDLPDVLGRDFSGKVVAVGQAVKDFKPGDEVYGAVRPLDNGTHAQFTVCRASSIALKPKNLTHIESASMPYVALTFISAVNPTCTSELRNKRVFLNGGAGGLGTFATQYLKSQGCEVTVSVSDDGRSVVESLKPDNIINYKSPNYKDELHKLRGFDLGFDCVGDDSVIPYIKRGGSFVTVSHPLLRNADQYGLICGLSSSLFKLGQNMQSTFRRYGVYYRWGYFMPNGSVLKEVSSLLEANKIKPVIDEVFPFNQVPSAYAKVGEGKGRGKTVIDILSEKLN